jgi:hypothetical protein
VASRTIDHAKYEGVQPESAEQRRRREQRERSNRVAERARYLLEKDPTITTMKDARRAAREQLDLEDEYEAGVRKGTVDPATGKETRKGKRAQRASGASRPASSRPHRSSRPAPKSSRTARKVSRAVVAPFGSAASAGWTLISGGLSLVLLYTALRQADAIEAFTNGLVGGLRRLSDPYTPLIPEKGEASPPPPARRVTHGGRTSR